jgi:hypothetical protein
MSIFPDEDRREYRCAWAQKSPHERQLDFIVEREAVRIKKEAGKSWPWTADPIIREWSFCNVRRESDRVTIWIRENWRDPHRDDPDLWFAMVVARRGINWPDTLAEIGYPVPWRPKHFLKTMADHKARGEICYGPAYVIPAGASGGSKAEYLADEVFGPMWANREKLRPRPGPLQAWFNTISRCHGIGSGFINGQIVADMKQVEPLKSAPDWFSYVVSGPGSRRGLNRALGRPVDSHWTERDWREECHRLHAKLAPELERRGIGRLCAQDFQNIALCEWDKHERALWGEGKPKRKFLKGRGAPVVGSAPRSDEAA